MSFAFPCGFDTSKIFTGKVEKEVVRRRIRSILRVVVSEIKKNVCLFPRKSLPFGKDLNSIQLRQIII